MPAKRLASQPPVNPLGRDLETHIALKTQTGRGDSILPHTPEAVDSYSIGDIYDESPLAISQEWEIDK
jgi:hypothetical protein